MKAILQDRYGPAEHVLQLKEIEKPMPGEGQILLRVRAAGVNPLDWHYVTGAPYIGRIAMGPTGPKQRRRGVDVAGQVEAVGAGVKSMKAGDDAFGWCEGAFAEYAVGPEGHFLPKPATMTYEEAAGVPIAAITALQGLRDFGKLRSGQRVLITGASGGVGSYAVQIAKSFGAQVTGVCSGPNVELVKSIGADHVLDYGRDDFTQLPQRYDVIYYNAGDQTIGAIRRTLAPNGILVYNNGTSLLRIAAAQLLARMNKNVAIFLAKPNHDDLALIARLIAEGKVRTVIDRTFPLVETAAAIAYVEAGHARGKVVVTV
jgi:NADPH:quinone reductase-like Zn-dependent oxidoreductase